MRMLELFSGTGRLATAFRERGWETVTLDGGRAADINCDITDWDYSELSGHKRKHGASETFTVLRESAPPL